MTASPGGDPQGVLRLVSDAELAGTVAIHAIDDAGARIKPITLELNPRAAVEFTASELQSGNTAKGLASGLGSLAGDVRLVIDSDVAIVPSAYVRSGDGALSTVHDTVIEARNAGTYRYDVAIFHPAANAPQQSRLRLINPGEGAARLMIAARDDTGATATGGTVELTLPGGGAQTLTAQQLEAGDPAVLTGRLGAGIGNWRLSVMSDRPIQAVNVTVGSGGDWSNLSTTAVTGWAPEDEVSFEARFLERVIVSRDGLNRLEQRVLAEGRIRATVRLADGGEVIEEGGYGFERTGRDAGLLSLRYDSGRPCTVSIFFDSPTSGWYASSCVDAADAVEDRGGGSWWALDAGAAPLDLGSGLEDMTYTVGAAIDVLTLPEPTGGGGGLTYSLSPEVPGLTFDAAARELSGTPTEAGAWLMTYRVRDASGDSDWRYFNIAVEVATGGMETTHGVGDTLSDLPTGSWTPDVTSGGSFSSSAGNTTVNLNEGGYIEEGGHRYTCQSAGGCLIANRRVTSGTVVQTASGTAPGEGTDDRAALTALYNATDGPNWAINDNWGSDAPLERWHGVATDNNGRVTWIDLAANQLRGSIPAELGDLSNLTYLYLHENQLSGPIPPELGNLSNLLDLFLYSNQLSGPIPPELGNLSSLVQLLLSINQLSGSIPVELGNLSNLEWVNLNSNQLSGSIPAELGNLSNLSRLFLHENQLSGSIPAQLGNLSNLAYLFLFDNLLSGPIPAELGNLANLVEILLSGNQFSGCIPDGLRDVATNDFSTLGLAYCGDSGTPGGQETTHEVGDTLTDLPTGSWAPEVTSGGSFRSSGGNTTVDLNEGGYIEEGGHRYTCQSSGGCTIENRRITSGTVVQTASGAAPGGGIPGDHGDDRASAAEVAAGSDTQGDLTAGDVDYFRVVVNTPGTLEAYTTGRTDTLGRLEDEGGAVLGRNDDGGAGTNFRISEDVSPGTYYVRVAGYSIRTAGDYTLHVRFTGSSTGASPSFATGSGPGDQTYTVGTAIAALTLPEASGGDGPLTYSLTPTVPGLTFNATASVRRLTGTPTAAGTYDMTYRVRDTDGDTDSITFAITVEIADGGTPGAAGDFYLDEDSVGASGITFANGRFHVVDRRDYKVYAYTASGQRDAAADFDLGDDNSHPEGIAFADGRFHVTDRVDDKVYAYSATGRRDAPADFDLDSVNSNPSRIAFANGRFHVVDWSDNKVYAYTASGQRDSVADFELVLGRGTDGIAFANGRFYFTDFTFDKVYAYTARGRRVSAADFDLDDDNGRAEGIVFANGRFYVVDKSERHHKVYAYTASGQRVTGGGSGGGDPGGGGDGSCVEVNDVVEIGEGQSCTITQALVNKYSLDRFGGVEAGDMASCSGGRVRLGLFNSSGSIHLNGLTIRCR